MGFARGAANSTQLSFFELETCVKAVQRQTVAFQHDQLLLGSVSVVAQIRDHYPLTLRQ